MTRRWWWFVALLVTALAGCSAFEPDGFSERGKFVRDQLLVHPTTANHYLPDDDFQLHYVSVGEAKKAVVVWVHGTPGSWQDGSYLHREPGFTDQVLLVLLDRPGWGESQYIDAPRLVTNFDEISERIEPLLEKLKADHPDVPLILLGHSWGGSVVPTIALDHPDLVQGLMVMAGGLDPKLTRPRWYNRFASTWLGKAIVGDALLAANVEIYALSDQLERMAPRLEGMKVPAIVLQGEEDELVSPKNAGYAEQRLPAERSKIVRLPKQGHLLQLERMPIIARCALALANDELSDCREE